MTTDVLTLSCNKLFILLWHLDKCRKSPQISTINDIISQLVGTLSLEQVSLEQILVHLSQNAFVWKWRFLWCCSITGSCSIQHVSTGLERSDFAQKKSISLA